MRNKMVKNKARTDKKLSRRKRSLLDFNNSRLRQKLLRKYYSSLLPSLGGPSVGSSENPKPKLSNGKNSANYEYNENDYWMTYLIQQHKISNKTLYIKQYVEETESFLRMKAVYDDIENGIVSKIKSICKDRIIKELRHKFSRRILTDSDTNQLREDLNKHIKNIENGRLFLINKNYFDMFLDYVRENPGRMADAFMKIMMFSEENPHKNDWMKYYIENIEKLFKTDIWDLNYAWSLTFVAELFSKINCWKDMRDFIGLFRETRNHVKHYVNTKAEAISHKDALEKLKNKIGCDIVKKALTNDFRNYSKKVLEMVQPENCLNSRMSGLQFNLPTVLQQENSLCDFHDFFDDFHDFQIKKKSYKRDKIENDEEFLLDYIKNDFDLYKNYISGFSQVFKSGPSNESPEKNLQITKAKRFKIYFVLDILMWTKIGDEFHKPKVKKDLRTWIKIAINGPLYNEYLRENRNSYKENDELNIMLLSQSLQDSRYAAVKGSENDAELETHVKNVCNALEYFERRIAQLVTPYSNITDILKSKIVNFAKCVKRILRSNDVRFNYHLLYVSLGHRSFNTYLRRKLTQSEKMSPEQQKRAFFELGLYSGDAIISAQAKKEDIRRPEGEILKPLPWYKNPSVQSFQATKHPSQHPQQRYPNFPNNPHPLQFPHYFPNDAYPLQFPHYFPNDAYPLQFQQCPQQFGPNTYLLPQAQALNFPPRRHNINNMNVHELTNMVNQYNQPAYIRGRGGYRGGYRGRGRDRGRGRGRGRGRDAPNSSNGPHELDYSSDETPSEPSCLEESTGVVRRKSLKRKMSRDTDQARKVKKLRMKICEFEEKLERLNQLMNDCQEQ